jgi:hypothetical protein|tara:strand:+ start:122 stop:598 length:477 start_codon:yes stop_codon:yes gene_type:complete
MMRRLLRLLGALCLLAIGYLIGSNGSFTGTVSAQPVQQQAGSGLSEETQQKVETALRALNAAMDALIEEKQYVPAIEGLNAFAVTTVAGDMIAELEAGRGVDPETYAGIYAGLAIDKVKEKLERDDQGRITFDGKLVRMYPLSKLKQLYSNRSSIAAQ